VEEFMGERESLPVRRAGGDGWSVAAALGLLAAAFLVERLVTSKTEDTQPKSEAKRDASAIGPATEGENSPSEIPAKGWKGVLLRVYADIGDHRILALAAGMTYYSILAIFRRSPPSFPFTAFFRILARSPSIWTSYPASCRAGLSM
jgi:hypothetical protein